MKKTDDVNSIFIKVHEILKTYIPKNPNSSEKAYFDHYMEEFLKTNEISFEELTEQVRSINPQVDELSYFDAMYNTLHGIHFVAVHFFCEYIEQTKILKSRSLEVKFDFYPELKKELLNVDLFLQVGLIYNAGIHTEKKGLYMKTGLDSYLDAISILATSYASFAITDDTLFICNSRAISYNYSRIDRYINIYNDIIEGINKKKIHLSLPIEPLNQAQQRLKSTLFFGSYFFVLFHEYTHYFLTNFLHFQFSVRKEELFCDLVAIRVILHQNNKLLFCGADLAMHLLYTIDFKPAIYQNRSDSSLYPSIDERSRLFFYEQLDHFNASSIGSPNEQYTLIPVIWEHKEHFEKITKKIASEKLYALFEKELIGKFLGTKSIHHFAKSYVDHFISMPPYRMNQELPGLFWSDGIRKRPILINTNNGLDVLARTFEHFFGDNNAIRPIMFFLNFIESLTNYSINVLNKDAASILGIVNNQEEKLTLPMLQTAYINDGGAESLYQPNADKLFELGIIGLWQDKVILNDFILNISV